MAFDLQNYETVEERLVRWWAAYPEARIVTTMVHYDAKTVVFRAEGLLNGQVIATGHAEEVLGSSPVNKTSFVENCETSAIGRMIGNSPIGTKPGARPSRQEMAKVERQGATIQPLTAHGGLATAKQLGFIKKLAKDRGLNDEQLFDECQERYGALPEMLTARQASQLIEAWK
jgi:hypothetical protein